MISLVLNDHEYAYKDNVHSVKILCINACGLQPKLKYPDFKNLCQRYGIVCVVKTKLGFEFLNFKQLAFVKRVSAVSRS